MLEVFTIGGGSFLVNIFNAVAAWSGGGGFRSMIQVVMVMGLIYALCCMAMNMDWRALFNWFVQSTLVYMMLIVPTVSIKVTDRINPSLPSATIDNVPLGLGIMASFTSQVGDWMTRQAETVFAMPNTLNLRSNGMVYGAKLLEQAQNITITNSEFRANLDEHIKQCVFYDVLLGHNSMNQMVRSNSLWAAMGTGSTSRGQKWVSPRTWGTSTTAAPTTVITCAQAYTKLTEDFNNYAKADLTLFGKRLFPKLSDTAALAKLETDLPVVARALHGGGYSGDATDYLRQQTAMDAFRAARETFSSAGWDSFAAKRADMQAKNTYTSIATQAMTWVPLLHIVLTAVFYAMFIVVFPLFLLPRTGLTTLKGYAAGFFYLAAWGPLYAILHSFVMSRAANWIEAQAPTGPTLMTVEGMTGVNNDIATVAGFLLMSVPFLAAGMARGAMAIAGQATSMLAPAQHAAEAAAVERTTGNYSFGNTSFANTSANNFNANKWDSTSSFNHGFGTSTYQDAGGRRTTTTSDGNQVFDSRPAMSNLSWAVSSQQAFGWSLQKSEEQLEQQLKSLTTGFGTSSADVRSNWNQQTRTNSQVAGGGSINATTLGLETATHAGSNLSLQDKAERGQTIENGGRNTQANAARTVDSFANVDTISGGIGATGNAKIPDKVPGIGGSGIGVNLGYNKKGEWTTLEDTARTNTDEIFNSNTVRDQNSRALTANVDEGRRITLSDGTQIRLEDYKRRETATADQTGSETRHSDTNERYRRIEETASQLEAVRETRSRLESGELQVRGDVTTAVASRYEAWRREQDAETQNAYASALDTRLSPERELLRARKIQELAAEYATPEMLAEVKSPKMDGPEVISMGSPSGPLPSEPGLPGLPPVAPVARPSGRRREDDGGGGGGHFDGRPEARRLGMGVKPGADIDNLHPSMRPVLHAVANATRELGLDPRVVTSGNDSDKHLINSAHYRDKALDFRGNNISVREGRQLAAEVESRLGDGYYVKFETFKDPSNNHLHVGKRG